MARFQEYLGRLRPQLDEAFRRRLVALLGDTVTDDLTSLTATMEGGKRIRGCLVCLVSDILGGSQETTFPRAVAVELIQTATLIHDDFVDQDTVRRNRPATWTLHGARKAVLIGDVIFSAAIKMMNDLSREDGQVILQSITEVAGGAFQEPMKASKLIHAIETDQWSGRIYEKIIRLKTGSLFGAACQLGALSAQASPELQKKSYGYGVHLGEAYQIADDLHDVKQCLSRGSMHIDQMVVLTPMLLYFVEEIKPYVLDVLKGRPLDVNGNVREHLRSAADRMNDEIDHRIGIALSEIDDRFPVNQYAELIRKAPREMMDMMMAQ